MKKAQPNRSRVFSAVAIGVFLLLIAGTRLAVAYTTNTSIYTPSNYTTFQPPAAGGSYTDAVFGTAVKRISDAMHTPDVGKGGMVTLISQEYSSMSPFNMDNTRLLLIHFSYFGLYDGSGNFIENLYNYGIAANTEPRWSRTDPNEFYYIVGNQFKKFNIGTHTSTVVHAFSEYNAISGMGESDICFDGKHFVLAGDSRYVFVYDLTQDAKGPVYDPGQSGLFDQIYITPNDNVIIGYYAQGSGRKNGVELFDKNMTFQRQLAHALGHMDVTRDTNGDEVVLWANGADPNLQVRCDAGVTKIRLSDAKQTCVWTGDWSLAIHITATDNNGWFFVDTYNPNDITPPNGWVTYTNELLQIKTDGSEVRRLVHHRSRPLNGYTYQPKPSVSRDGSKLVFASNFGEQVQLGYPKEYTDTYMIDLTNGSSTSPSGGGTGTGSNPGGTTPGGTTTNNPPPATAGSTTRIEENNAAVTFAGSWSTNSNSSHSGGSAKLSMDSGSSAKLTFNGTAVSFILFTDQWSGIASISVDGTAKGEVDTYANPAKAQSKLYTISGLADGSHTVTIGPTGRKNASSSGLWIWVDAFDVTTGSSTSSTGGGTPPGGGTTTGGGTPPGSGTTTGGGTTPGGGTTTGGGTTPPGGTTTTPSATRIQDTSTNVAYTGSWTTNNNAAYSGGTAHGSMNVGSLAQIGFIGTAVSFIVHEEEWSGIANIYVDGALKAQIDAYASPSKPQAVLYTVSGLPNGAHKVAIGPSGNKNASSHGNWIWVDAFDAVATDVIAGSVTDPLPTTTPSTPPQTTTGTQHRVEDSTASVQWTGTWNANSNAVQSGGSAKLSMTPGSRATFTFTGTSVSWIGYKDAWSGLANVYVDGTLKSVVDMYMSGSQAQSKAFTLSGLPWGSHTIVVEAAGKKSSASLGSWVWVDAFDYVGQ
jgi:hypothetical protein